MPLGNDPIHVKCRIMRNVMASSTEAELGGLFENCQKLTSMRNALVEMGHSQPQKPVETENAASNRIVNGPANNYTEQ